MVKTWNLDDVSWMALEAPYTFYLPSPQLIAQLRLGDVVKLIFRCPVENDRNWSAERMWVEIVQISGNEFRGKLKNTPNYIPDLSFDQELVFSPQHIIQTQREDPVPHLAGRYAKKCFVTNRVLNDKMAVDYLSHEEIDEAGKSHDFSGWTLCAGDETDEYLDNEDNWHFVSLGLILNQDDRFRCLLDTPESKGKQFQWDVSLKSYQEIIDQ